ncbi:hypothetical protein [Polaribacter aquimarinus]|uniref:Uncharacterized protein n=1 Tax=Polaribacter aquimarinus TaxID=2100726 RepID=A0A2U2JDK8_9FLAO|nr:hypothetical protein [Polaribacter aquimarinus]PWG06443.1 hypothetical protein DIS07_01025 [Polaribacter aquimarinus]
MEKSAQNNKQKNFLKEVVTGDISNHHKKYLGTTIPEGYFEKSKLSILDKIKEETTISETSIEVKKQKVFWLQPKVRYVAAASLVFILSLTIWLQKANNNTLDDYGIELLSFNDDVLVNSLFLDDDELDAYASTTVINEIVIKAELSEQKMDDLILDSMILDDTLSDNTFIESLIL